MKILSFGSLNLDYVYQVDHFVDGGETIASLGREMHCGGKGLNQAVALARAGATVLHAGKVGPEGGFLVDFLKQAGVDASLVAVDNNQTTGHAIIQIEQGSGQNCIIIHSGANGAIDEAFADDVILHFDAGDFAVFQNEISSVEYAIARCKKQGMTVVFNPSPLTDALVASDIYSHVDYLLVNEIEGEALSGKSEPKAICEALRGKYPNCVVVLTLGTRGVVLYDGSAFYEHGIYKVEVVDTTGAGDTFTGFFVAAMAEGTSYATALERASRASALSVSKHGAAQSVPTKAQVAAAVLELRG